MKTRKRCPKHPGYILNELYLQPLSLPVKNLAENIGVSSEIITDIINEKKSITPEMAMRLTQAFPNTTSESWLSLQRNYDSWQTVNNYSEWKPVEAISSENLYKLDEAAVAYV